MSTRFTVDYRTAFAVIREWRIDNGYAFERVQFAEYGNLGEFIYFATAGGRVKVGWTRSPDQRERQLGSGARIEVVIRDGTLSDERALHRCLAPFRIEGEWYEPHSAVLSLVYRLRNTARGHLPRPGSFTYPPALQASSWEQS